MPKQSFDLYRLLGNVERFLLSFCTKAIMVRARECSRLGIETECSLDIRIGFLY